MAVTDIDLFTQADGVIGSDERGAWMTWPFTGAVSAAGTVYRILTATPSTSSDVSAVASTTSDLDVTAETTNDLSVVSESF